MVHAPGPQSMVITQNVPMQQQVKLKLISYKIDMKAKVTMIILLLFLLKSCMITLAPFLYIVNGTLVHDQKNLTPSTCCLPT